MIRFFFCLLMLTSIIVSGQEPQGDLALGQWKSHLPYSTGVSVTQSAETVFFATDQSLFSVDKEEHSIQLYNKVSGLSDIGIRQINYNQSLNVLLIAYSNSNIDLLDADGITNISDIKRKSIPGDKRINNIYFNGDFAWLSCGFGVVQMDLVNEETKSTTFTPFIVNAVRIHNGYLFASTENGIYRIINDGSANIQDFSIWERMSTANGLPSAYYSNALEELDGQLFADVNDSLFVFGGVNWTFHYYKQDFGFKYLLAGNDQLLAGMVHPTAIHRVVRIQKNGSSSQIWENEIALKEPQAIEDEEGNIWVSDISRGFGQYTSNGDVVKFRVEGPYSLSAGDVTIDNDEVWIAATNLESKWNPKSAGDGLYSLIDGDWEVFRPNWTPILNPVRDINVVKIHPVTNSVFAGSYNEGLIEYDRSTNTPTFTIHKLNTTLQAPLQSPNSYRVSGLAFDSENNLWVSNYGAANPISVFSADRQWTSFSPPTSVKDLTKVVIDQNNFKWFGTNAEGVLVFDSGANLQDIDDDRYRVINTNNSEMQSNDVLSLAVDLEGSVWVGTAQGVFVFECFNQAVEASCIGRRPTFREGNFDDYLLKTESVNAIAVDGANRKWFGTTNGVFVLSKDIEKQVFRFTAENSPLFDNNVIDIAINDNTGEVFFTTESGIISYRNNAIVGNNFIKKDEVVAFPNPVRHDFEGEIAIKGLVENSDIKITDISGSLVYQTTSLGGQAVWNGRDYNGRRANTGVYLVYATSKDGSQKVVTKVMIVN